MLEKFAKNWWLYAVRGLAAIIFGIVALRMPSQTLQALVLLFGSFAFVDGIFAIFAGIASSPYFDRWWAVLLEGVAGVIIGLLTFFYPGLTTVALVYLIAVWALVTGIFEIVAAIQFRKEMTGEWMLILGGLLSIAFAVMLFVSPAAGAASVIFGIGFYAIAFGVSEIIFAFRLHSLGREVEKVIQSV